jgi:hypothetical protein
VRRLPNFYLDIGYLGSTKDYVQEAFNQTVSVLQPYYEVSILDPQVIEWETNFRRVMGDRIIAEFELDTFVFLSEHFSCGLFQGIMDYLTMDYYWLQAWVNLGVIRQQQLSDIEKERERKTQDIMDKRNELNAPSAFDKLASNIR